MITREEWIERKTQWERFNRWQAEQPQVEREAAELIADVGAVLDWMPELVYMEDLDIEKRGIQILRSAFELLSRYP